MPYNNAPISPSDDISGATQLPLARVKKILHVDENLGPVSANAAFAVTIATELFIRYFAEQAMNIVKTEKKPRRNIQYKDLANAVSRVDSLEFLTDVIPKTSTYREYKASRSRKAHENQPLQNGQTTLDTSRGLPQRPVNTEPTTGDDGSASDNAAEDHARGQAANNETSKTNGQQYRFEHYDPKGPNGNSRKDETGDVIMG